MFENPVSGERAVVLVDPDRHPERILVARLLGPGEEAEVPTAAT
ncbi:MAG TPA: hypothetical protein VMS11_13900 [Solirubrobacterales bacterium]|nr:hypothetical protein [Solirubrobacterales bacterium]